MQTTIRIKIGASADRSIEAVFGTLEQRSKRAARVVQQNLNSATAGNGRGGPYRSRVVEAGYESQARAAESSAKRQSKAFDSATRDQIRFFKQLSRVAETELNKQARAVARAAEQQARSAQRAQDRFATRTSYRATRFLFPPPSGILGSARRFGSDLLRGAGVDFGFGSAVGRGVDLQRSAINLSNQAYQPSAGGAAAQRVDPNQLIGESRTIASKYGMDPAQIMKAHEAFVGLTGDLKTSRESMDEMAKLSAATGSNITEMAEAQANVANALGNTENKGAKVSAIMRVAAGQGKLGAIEIKNLATGMSGLAAKAPMFEGDTGQNIEKLAALAQLARAGGGAKSAREAITGVERFADTFATPARVKEFKNAGVNVYTKSGKVRDPFELIKESLVATGGDPLKMSKLFQSVMGKRGVTALTTAYTSAGGGQKGLQAVQAEFDKFTKGAAMSRELVEENAARAAASDAAKAQRFQNNLDVIASKLAADLLPQLEKLAPKVLQVAEAFSNLVKWVTDNPGKAITAAIVTSITRAGLESAGRAAIEEAIKRWFNRGTLPVPGTTPGGGAPAGGAVVPALAVGAAVAGTAAFYDQGNKLMAETGGQRNILSEIPGFGSIVPKSMQDIMPYLTGTKVFDIVGAATQGLLDPTGKGKKVLGAGGMNVGAAGAAIGAAGLGVPQAPVDPTAMGRGMADALVGRELRVRVTNADEIKSDKPTVDPSGRTKPPGQK